MHRTISRRTALGTLCGWLPLLYQPLHPTLSPGNPGKKYKLGACDWSLGHHSDPEALREAQRIGLDGVQISLGKLENNMHLRQKDIQNLYKHTAEETGIQISSLAIGELNQYPYKSDPQTISWVRNSIDVANSLKMGYDIYEEIKWLGDQICEVHMKENGYLLGKGKVNFERVRESLEMIDFKGWMQIEGALPSGADRRESYQKNTSYLRKVFDI